MDDEVGSATSSGGHAKAPVNLQYARRILQQDSICLDMPYHGALSVGASVRL
jgi:hypothetical protein